MSRKWLFLLIPLTILTACTPPPPPPSPTPRLTIAPVPVETITQVTPPPLETVTATLTGPATPAPTLTPPITEITVWESLPAPQSETLREEVQAFAREFPQYSVTLARFETPEDFMTPLIAGQREFEVVLAAPPLLNSLWATKQIAPLNDFFSPSFIDGFAAATLQGAIQDEVLWGLPDTAGFHLLLFYNTKLVDTPPTTMDQLLDIAQNLTEGNRWGLAVNSYDPLWLVPWLSAYGGWLTDAEGQPTLDTPVLVSALTLHQRWHETAEAVAPLVTYQEMREQFLAGNIGMMIDGEWALDELAQGEGVEWEVAPLPTLGEVDDFQAAAPLILARYWAVSRDISGDQALAAATFLEFITRPERQLEWTTRYGLLPTHRQALNAPTIVNDPHLRISAMQMLAGRALPLGVNADLLLEAMREPLRGVMAGELTPEEAAEMMQENVER